MFNEIIPSREKLSKCWLVCTFQQGMRHPTGSFLQSKMIHLLTLTKCLKVQLGNALFMMVTVQLSNPLWCLNIVLVSLKIPHDYLNKWITINSFLTLSAEYFHIKIVYSNLICKVAFLFNVFCKMNQVKELNVYWCEVNYSHFHVRNCRLISKMGSVQFSLCFENEIRSLWIFLIHFGSGKWRFLDAAKVKLFLTAEHFTNKNGKYLQFWNSLTLFISCKCKVYIMGTCLCHFSLFQ